MENSMAILLFLKPFGVFTAIWHILWSFGIYLPFWYVAPRKIWQPWFLAHRKSLLMLQKDVF
jgi:hypothetical protein